MSTSANSDWQGEFGLVADGAKVFLTKDDLGVSGAAASQGHILRRAFDLLKLDGVLCTQNAPLVYFKQVKRIDAAEVARLHRTFWNHGGAPILVLIDPKEVHVYSGLVRPTALESSTNTIPGLVESLDRASTALKEFLPSVESGEFFRRHARSFDPAQRVDRALLDNLQSTRDKLAGISTARLDTKVLDALLCRLVFACYLFDRGVVGETYLRDTGLRDAVHLRDVLGLQPRTNAKKYLYALFEKLGRDFNGDLFSDNLEAEARQVAAAHIGPLDDFFRATDVLTGQGSFWPYDFAAIPVEAISAIYERFLQGSDKRQGAFYTPRFLAELVLDIALSSMPSLLSRRYLDPACGSGIFLVGLFNRMAEEWKLANPDARNDRRARELRKILCESIHGVDINPTACRITAFSLYLAYLDQLTPRDIQELQEKGHKLPTLVHYPSTPARRAEGHIWCADFFSDNAGFPVDADLVIGNPPWGSTATEDTSAAKWCAAPQRRYPIPDRQISSAFVWKAAHHVAPSGSICLVLPHGTLFNHSQTALQFQRAFFERHAVDQVLNLTDYQFFLFAEARHPAIVIRYGKQGPEGRKHPIEYWAPKADWLVTRAEIIAVTPEDRVTLTVGDVLDDLKSDDAPQIWKQWFWASARDRRLLDRLGLYSRLRDHIRLTTEKDSAKPWLIAEGFQPMGKGDDPAKAKTIRLPSRCFIEASSPKLDLFLLPDECQRLAASQVTTRRKIKGTDVFRAPHVLVSQGFTSVAFADFDVSFQHALRGITGPKGDRDLLVFLAAYLRSPIARFFLFHTSSNWGVSRQKVHLEELLRLPFPLPEMLPDPKRAGEIVKDVAHLVTSASSRAADYPAERAELVKTASASIERLVSEYFDILPLEQVLIDDTVRVSIPSVRPSRAKPNVPAVEPSDGKLRDAYVEQVCSVLNGWAKNGPSVVRGRSIASAALGIGLAVLEKTPTAQSPATQPAVNDDLLVALDRLQQGASQRLKVFQLIRGAKVFDQHRLYVVKPIAQRFWTRTAALNDADEIAGTILMHTPQRLAW